MRPRPLVRVLLDEQLPRQRARHVVGYDVRTIQQQSWAGLKNSVLLRVAAAADFAVFITGDRNLEYEQNLTNWHSGVVVLAAASNAFEELLPLIPERLAAIESVRPDKSFAFPADPPRYNWRERVANRGTYRALRLAPRNRQTHQ
jgi:hypothetical protein